jgi:hypothetical protein
MFRTANAFWIVVDKITNNVNLFRYDDVDTAIGRFFAVSEKAICSGRYCKSETERLLAKHRDMVDNRKSFTNDLMCRKEYREEGFPVYIMLTSLY